MGSPDYSQVVIPSDKKRDEYSYIERRAAILRLIEQRGHPWGMNSSQLAREFGVSHTTIDKDFDRLKEWYCNRIGDDAEFSSEVAYKRIIQEAMDDGNHELARRTLESWNEWLQDTGNQQKEPDNAEMSVQFDVETVTSEDLDG